MEDRGNKTIICSVFFLDIVEYSKKSVSGQISQKERFNAFLSNAIRDVPVNDRIILDTGDGAAISFLGDVEDALRAALRMRKSLMSDEGLIDPPLLVRMGVNLGPVRLVKDINGQPNIVGDGINVAQRVMGFAGPGQILVSRSYYDAASRLSQEYTGMFQYCGARTDKHVREHEVYEIGFAGDMSATQPALRYKSKTVLVDRLHKIRAKIKAEWKILLSWSDE
ncbi:MAG: adenylate/guanylate cyclase domain-containing protein, partial [Acidithiobacillus sp.]|nr:adenylate/guanylate cyclase domain-containing protein [Acidithiobacillus sp.]